jgi:hypothetical protein
MSRRNMREGNPVTGRFPATALLALTFGLEVNGMAKGKNTRKETKKPKKDKK